MIRLGSVGLFAAAKQVQSSLIWRWDVLSGLVVQVVLAVAMVWFWRALYAGSPAASAASAGPVPASGGDIPLDAMATYAVLATAWAVVLGGGPVQLVTDRVRSGAIAIDLIRPTPAPWLWLAQNLGASGAAALRMGLPLILATTLLVHVPWPAGWAAALWTVPALALAWLVNWLIAACFALVAFWTMEMFGIDGLRGAMVRILSGSIIPLWFLPGWVQTVCSWLPFTAIYQGPLSLWIGRTTDPLAVLGTQLAWVAVLSAVFLLIWRQARRHVQVQGG